MIDNYGDIGFVYRFARALKRANPDIRVRVFVDDLITFNVINAKIDINKRLQEYESIFYVRSNILDNTLLDTLGTAEVIIEAFACIIPDIYMKRAYHESILLINLEHLSAESWVEEYHCKESFLPEGTLKKFYFMPGFTKKTGGLLIDTGQSPTLISSMEEKISFLNTVIPHECAIEPYPDMLIATVFTYKRGMNRLIQDCLFIDLPVYLLVFGEKSITSIEHAVQCYTAISRKTHSITINNLNIIKMPYLPQVTYDLLLEQTDFNIVRGEDSLVRALLAGKPFIWNAYIQDNNYQIVKVQSLCDMMQTWFCDPEDFKSYEKIMIEFNRAPEESIYQVTDESFVSFFQNLKKIKPIFHEISYFMVQNCDLMKNISTFIRNYPNNKG